MVHDEQAAALEAPATALPAEACATMLTCGAARPPELCAAGRSAPALAGDMSADGCWFWWPWAGWIAPAGAPAAAAAQVAGTLSAG